MRIYIACVAFIITTIFSSTLFAEEQSSSLAIVSQFFDRYLPGEYNRIREAIRHTDAIQRNKTDTKHILYSEIVNNITHRVMAGIIRLEPELRERLANNLPAVKERIHFNLYHHHALNLIDNISQLYFDHKDAGLILQDCNKAKDYHPGRHGNYKICVSGEENNIVTCEISIEQSQRWVWRFRKLENRYVLYDLESDKDHLALKSLLLPIR